MDTARRRSDIIQSQSLKKVSSLSPALQGPLYLCSHSDDIKDKKEEEELLMGFFK